MKEQYFDKMEIRNKRTFKYRGYTFVSYDDFFMGEWMGNVNVLDKDERNVMHATLAEPNMSQEELEDYAKSYFSFRDLLLPRFQKG